MKTPRRELIKVITSITAPTDSVETVRRYAAMHLGIVMTIGDAELVLNICSLIKGGADYYDAIAGLTERELDQRAENLKRILCAIKHAVVREGTTIVTRSGRSVLEELDHLLRTECGFDDRELIEALHVF